MLVTEIKTAHDAMRRWPRLTAHLICESLGYFTPEGAAVALLMHYHGEEFGCEWYAHLVDGSSKDLAAINREVIARAFRWRHNHRGYMSNYILARKLVEMNLAGEVRCVFASWF